MGLQEVPLQQQVELRQASLPSISYGDPYGDLCVLNPVDSLGAAAASRICFGQGGRFVRLAWVVEVTKTRCRPACEAHESSLPRTVEAQYP